MIFLKHLMSCGMGQRQSHPSFLYDPVAQPVEHRPFKAGVLGSSLRWSTSRQDSYESCRFFLFLANTVCFVGKLVDKMRQKC